MQCKELQHEDEYYLLNLPIPLLPSLMPLLQFIIMHMPFPPSALLACNTHHVSSHPIHFAQDSQLDVDTQQAREWQQKKEKT